MENLYASARPYIGVDFCGSTKEYKDVRITKVDNGWIVKVGCATFVETDWNKICKALKEYWDDPEKAEKKYYKK